MIGTTSVRSDLPQAPVEIRDEVELYAREYGRHATLHFMPTFFVGNRVLEGTWMVRFTLRPDDPRLELYREGKVPEEPTEDVWLHEPDETHRLGYRPLKIEEMGATGVREFLERGNSWGRGEHGTLLEQMEQAADDTKAAREKRREDGRDEARAIARDKRRSRLKIPFLSVGKDVKDAGTTTDRPDTGPSTTR